MLKTLILYSAIAIALFIAISATRQRQLARVRQRVGHRSGYTPEDCQ